VAVEQVKATAAIVRMTVFVARRQLRPAADRGFEFDGIPTSCFGFLRFRILWL
jgi:hypothetical protein